MQTPSYMNRYLVPSHAATYMYASPSTFYYGMPLDGVTMPTASGGVLHSPCSSTVSYPVVIPITREHERDAFHAKLHTFRSEIGQPIVRLPTLGFKELDLYTLYKEVTKRRGIDAVIARKQWKEVAEALCLPSSCTDSGFRLRLHYKKYLEAFERKFFSNGCVQADYGSEKVKNGNQLVCATENRKRNGVCGRATKNELNSNAQWKWFAEDAGTSPCRSRDEAFVKVQCIPNDKDVACGPSQVAEPNSSGSVQVPSSPRTHIRKRKRRSVGHAEQLTVNKKANFTKQGVPGKDGTEKNVQHSKWKSAGHLLRAAQDAARKVQDERIDEESDITKGSNTASDSTSSSEDKARYENAANNNQCSSLACYGLSPCTEESASMDGTSSGGQFKETISEHVEETQAEFSKKEKKFSKVDFSVLDESTLKRYIRVHGLEQCHTDASTQHSEEKLPLQERVAEHFQKTPLPQEAQFETVLNFISAIRKTQTQKEASSPVSSK